MDSFANSKQIEEISAALTKFTSDLQNQIRDNHDILIHQATWVGILNSALEVVDNNMKNLKYVTDKTKNNAITQYSTIEKQTKILENIRATSHQIRLCSRFINLINQLKNCDDPINKQILLSKIELLLEDKSLRKFRFIQNELIYVSSLKI